MKKILLSMAASLAALATMASPVGVEQAKTAAAAFFRAQTGRSASVSRVVAQTDSYYIMNMSQGGWVILSADDVATPVLGYNTTGAMEWHSMPSNMLGMLNSYTREISAIRQARGVRNAQWSNIQLSAVRGRSGATVDPLIPVNWDQSKPYNNFCPTNGSKTALVGCVAVAMSQAMAVQVYPVKPQGQKSYTSANFGYISIDYDREPKYNWPGIVNSTDMDDVARLLYHAGVSVEMNYGIEGSGIPSAEVNRITNALAKTFGYSAKDLHYVWRTTCEQNGQDWESLVLNELSAGRAVIYNAVDTKGNYGHSFNVDGYDGTRYHVNWGWGGYGNGYFALNDLRDASMNMNYDSGHVIVIGIGSPNQVLKSIELSDNVVDEGMPAGTVVAQVTVNGTTPEKTFVLELKGPYNPETQRYDEVPFKLQGDLIVTTEQLAHRDKPYELNIVVQDGVTGNRLNSLFPVTVCKRRTVAQATSVTFNRLTNELKLRTRNGVNYTITGEKGTVIAQGTLSPVPLLTISMDKLENGRNTFTLTDGNDTKTLIITK